MKLNPCPLCGSTSQEQQEFITKCSCGLQVPEIIGATGYPNWNGLVKDYDIANIRLRLEDINDYIIEIKEEKQSLHDKLIQGIQTGGWK